MFTDLFGDLFDFDGRTSAFELYAAAECCGVFDDPEHEEEEDEDEESDDYDSGDFEDSDDSEDVADEEYTEALEKIRDWIKLNAEDDYERQEAERKKDGHNP